MLGNQASGFVADYKQSNTSGAKKSETFSRKRWRAQLPKNDLSQEFDEHAQEIVAHTDYSAQLRNLRTNKGATEYKSKHRGRYHKKISKINIFSSMSYSYIKEKSKPKEHEHNHVKVTKQQPHHKKPTNVVKNDSTPSNDVNNDSTYVQCPEQPKSSKNIEVSFLYSVETKSLDVRVFQKKLEWAMMNLIAEKMMRCSNDASTMDGIVRVDSTPVDKVLSKCIPSESAAESCQEMMGIMSVHVTPTDTSEKPILAMIHTLIHSACKGDYFVKDGDVSEDLVKVNYIGEGELNDVTPVKVEGQGQIRSVETGNTGNAKLLTASLVPIAFLSLLAAAMFGSQKRTIVTGNKTTIEEGNKSLAMPASDGSFSEQSSLWDHDRERLYGVLGETYCTHNVHTCKSATCQLCFESKNTVQFINSSKNSTYWPKHLASITEDAEDVEDVADSESI